MKVMANGFNYGIEGDVGYATFMYRYDDPVFTNLIIGKAYPIELVNTEPYQVKITDETGFEFMMKTRPQTTELVVTVEREILLDRITEKRRLRIEKADIDYRAALHLADELYKIQSEAILDARVCE